MWNLPHHRNPNFVGRQDELAVLDSEAGSSGLVVHALTGLGGVGKTQLAVEYAYRHAGELEVVWWVRAEDAASARADLADLAGPLELAEAGGSEEEALAAVRRWLEGHQRWVVVLDNAEDPDAVAPLLPRGGGGRVVVTSRRQDWPLARGVEVEVLEPGEATEFVLRRSGRPPTPAASVLAEELGRLPLALEQAGAYLAATPGLSVDAYLGAYRARSAEVLARGRPHGYPATVATTWELAFEQVEATSPAAAELLALLAFLAPDDIALSLVGDAASELPGDLAEAAGDPLGLADAAGVLGRYSLVRGTSADAVGIHRLVQAVVRDRLGPEGRSEWAGVAVRLLRQAFPPDSDDVRTWAACARLLPHARAAASHAEVAGVEPEATAWVLDRAATYLRGRAELAEAKVLRERAVAIAEAAYGPDHTEVAALVNNLALVRQALGDLGGARAGFERALRIDEAAYGPEHTAVAIDVNNLANVLRDLDDLDGARAGFERALGIDEAAYGPDHTAVARDANNLASVLRDLGDLAGARAGFERALGIDEAAYGPEHPTVAIRVNNLALVLRDLGDVAGARAGFERALSIDEAAYGPDHPTVARNVNNLASVLRDLGDLAGARAGFERALRIDEAAYGPEHPTVAIRVNNLALVLRDLGELAGARAGFERALRIDEAAYGRDHTAVARDVNNLASVLQDLGDLAGARAGFERALRIDEGAYGPDHTEVATDVNNLAHVLRDLGDLDGARAGYERALRIHDGAYGPNHPTAAIIKANLDGLQAQGDDDNLR